MNAKLLTKAFLCLCTCALVAAGCSSKKDDPEPEPVKHFEVSVTDIATMSATLNIKPDEEGRPYYYAIVRKAYFESLEGDFQTAATTYYKGNIDAYVDWGESREDAIAELSQEEDLVDYVADWLYGSTTYYVLVGYVTKDGEADGDFESVEFRTASPARSNNTFKVEISNIGARSIDYSVTPSNDEDEYSIVIVPKSEIESYTDVDELVEYLYASKGWLNVYSGTTVASAELVGDTEYAFLVFGIRDYAATTALTKEEFTTLKPGDPTKLTFTLSMEQGEIQGFEVNFRITPSDNTIDYFYELVNADATAEQVLKYEEETIERFATYGLDRESYFNMYSSHGEDSHTYTIYPGEKGKIAVIPIKNGTTEFACDPIFSDVITFPDAQEGEATVDVSWDKYYDGAAIAALDPNYDYFGTNAVFPVSITCTGTRYFYNLFVADGKTYERNQIIYTLLSGTPSSWEADCYVPFGRDGVIYAVAVDEDGKCGPLFEKTFNFSKDGVSPAQEFIDSKKAESGYSVKAASSAEASSSVKKAPMVYMKKGMELPVAF